MRREKYRDLLLTYLNEETVLVVSCDSSGAVGPKEEDLVEVPGYVLGRLTARVALLEVLAVGAKPFNLVSALCVEPFPLGEEINQGIREELQSLGLDSAVMMTGSSEKNFPVLQSALGITVIAAARPEDLLIKALQSGDAVLLLGWPKLGMEIPSDYSELVEGADLQKLLACPQVREIVPVGSRGIAGEIGDLEQIYQLRMFWDSLPPGLDLEKSGGPSTCVLAIGDLAALQSLSFSKPTCILGHFAARCSLKA